MPYLARLEVFFADLIAARNQERPDGAASRPFSVVRRLPRRSVSGRETSRGDARASTTRTSCGPRGSTAGRHIGTHVHSGSEHLWRDDYIFASGSMFDDGLIEDASVVDEAEVGDLSDHLPLVLDLARPPRIARSIRFRGTVLGGGSVRWAVPGT